MKATGAVNPSGAKASGNVQEHGSEKGSMIGKKFGEAVHNVLKRKLQKTTKHNTWSWMFKGAMIPWTNLS